MVPARGCKIKKAEYQRRWRAANPERQKAYHKKYRARETEYQREWRAANPEKRKAYKKVYAEKKPDAAVNYSRRYRTEQSAKVKAAYKKWCTENQGRVNYLRAKRRAAQRQAQPPWLTAEQKKEIADLYVLAREKGMQVDHIVPLTHKRVCGLHVPWNLQLLTKSENYRKHNSWE